MKTFLFTLIGLAGLALAGCKTDPAVPSLERDNRAKEDEIYRLRWKIEDLQDQLQGQAPARSRVSSEPTAPSDPIPPGERDEAPRVAPRPNSMQSGPMQSAPRGSTPTRARDAGGPSQLQIEMPQESLPSGEIPDVIKTPGTSDDRPPRFVPGSNQPNTLPRTIPGGGDSPIGPPGIPGTRSGGPGGGTGWVPREIPADPVGINPVPNNGAASSKVAQITVNDKLTGGIGNEKTSSDHGLLVVVEPRDISGNIVDAPAEINIALFDTALSGEGVRLGRWDFTAAETTALLRPDPGRGIHLMLPWVGGPPEHGKLKVFVRYMTQDGRKLQIAHNVDVAVAREQAPSRLPPVAAQSGASQSTASQSATSQAASTSDDSASQPAAHTASRPKRPVWSPDRPY